MFRRLFQSWLICGEQPGLLKIDLDEGSASERLPRSAVRGVLRDHADAVRPAEGDEQVRGEVARGGSREARRAPHGQAALATKPRAISDHGDHLCSYELGTSLV